MLPQCCHLPLPCGPRHDGDVDRVGPHHNRNRRVARRLLRRSVNRKATTDERTEQRAGHPLQAAAVAHAEILHETGIDPATVVEHAFSDLLSICALPHGAARVKHDSSSQARDARRSPVAC